MEEEVDELQVKEFLKRSEVRTMKKDLRQLREGEALQERDKIVNIKTLEEERAEKEAFLAKQAGNIEKQGREKILQKTVADEREAEAQLKDYANEAEKQQIFLFEAQRLALIKQVDNIEKEEEPKLMLDKNGIALEKKSLEVKLNAVIEEERKLEAEQKVIADKEKDTNVPAEKKALEQRRWELESEREKIEKKRWAVEKEIQGKDELIVGVDKKLQIFTLEKESIKERIKEIDKKLRDIYSKIIFRVEEVKAGRAGEKAEERKAFEAAELARKEQIRRQQWREKTGEAAPSMSFGQEKEALKGIPNLAKEKLQKAAEDEEERRKQFLKNIEARAKEEEDKKV